MDFLSERSASRKRRALMFFSRSWKLAYVKQLMLPVLILLLASGLLLGSPSRGTAQDHQESTRAEIDEIKAAIAREGAEWVAGETSLSRLSHAERQSRLGLLPPVIMEGEWVIEQFTPRALPSHTDWRDNGGNYVTPVRDQKSCGSCWAFATTAALESVTLRALGTPGVDLNLAEQILLSCSGAGNCQQGGSIGSASSYIKDTGLPLESCYGYTGANGTCSSACSDWEASSYKITNYSYVTSTSPTVETLKNALYTYGPLVTTMQVYSDFDSYESGIYSYVTGYKRGGHAILLVGYDDAGQYFICKNSWGTWWGESGYFKIAYSQLNSIVNFGDYTIAYDDAIPPNTTETISQPTTLSGSTSGTMGTSYTYTTGGSASSEEHSVQYYFDWGDGTNSGWLTVGTTSAQKSWSSSGTYAVKARARCSLHPTVVSSWTSLNVGIGCATPGTPSNPSPSSGATGVSASLTLSWTACANTNSYDVYLGTSSPPSFVTNTTSTSYGVSGLSGSMTYYWKIVAKNTCGGGTSGSVWSFTTTAETITTPNAPSGASTGSVGSGYTYQTGGSTSSLGHSVQYFFDWGDGTNSGWLAVGTTSASKSWAAPGTYSVKAMARCSAHQSTTSSWSLVTSVRISEAELTGVKVLSPNGGETISAGSTYTVRWEAPSNAVKFRVYYSINKGYSWKSITAAYVMGKSYDWVVPTLSSSKKDCLIKVNGYDQYNTLVSYDRSDQPFRIEVVRSKSRELPWLRGEHFE
jgi:C1A family cysteine protease